jgi:hypothetical protein
VLKRNKRTKNEVLNKTEAQMHYGTTAAPIQNDLLTFSVFICIVGFADRSQAAELRNISTKVKRKQKTAFPASFLL